MSYLSFKLNEEFVEGYRDITPPWGFVDVGGNSVSEIVFMRTYSRMKEDGTKEKWFEVCRRVIEGMYSIQKDFAKENRIPWNDNKAQKSAQEAFDRLFNFKWTPPGRGLWAMGTPLVNRDKNSAPLQNCAFVSTEDMTKYDPGEPFAWLMEASMLGIGVGFDVRGVEKNFTITEPEETGETHVIPDTREGWCEAVKIVINAYLCSEKKIPSDFDFSQIRPEGEPIKTFGGTASGPEPLKKLIQQIDDLLYGKCGEYLDSLTIMDIMNMIGVCVVAGNVRRTAELALGSTNDPDFINAKNYEDNPYRAEWGWMSNNSVAVNVGDDLSGIVDNIAVNGEPGIIWMDTTRQYGRLIDPPNNKDYRVAGYNPCQPGWAKVLTPYGIRTIDEISKGDYIWSKEGWTEVVDKWSTGNNEVYLYRTSSGVFYGTEKHKVISDGAKIEAKDAETIDVLEGLYEKREDILPEYVMAGLLLGDGSVHNASDNLIYLCIGKNDQDYFKSEVSHLIKDHRPGLCSYAYEVDTFLESENLSYTFSKKIPDYLIKSGSKNELYSLLRGIYSANGSVVSNRVSLKTTSKKFLEDVQTLLSSLGIRSYFTTNKPKNITFKNGDYICKERYDLNITTDRQKFLESIGFIQDYKNSKVFIDNTHYKKDTYDIVSKDFVSVEETFDITVNNSSHTYWAQGCNVSNCAEQSLESKEMCTLVETYICNHDSVEDYERTLKFAYLYAKTVTLMPTHWEETNAIMKRNRRIGTSMSDIANFVDNFGMPKLREIQDKGYNAVQYYDHLYSEWLGVRESIKTTTVKPSGTVSLLAGASPGVHWPPGDKFHKRGVVFRAKDPAVEEFKKAGYTVKPYANDPEGSVFVQFLIESRAKRSEKDVTVFEKIHLASVAQKYWSDNSVSVTISYDVDKEAKYIPTVIAMYEGSLKTVSFLPMGNEVYQDMPYQSSSKEEYEAAKGTLKPVNMDVIYNGKALEAEGEAFCNTDKCEIPQQGES